MKAFNIKETILQDFLLSYFLKNERKKSNTLIISFLMLYANKNNSSIIIKSSFIKLSIERTTWFSSFTFQTHGNGNVKHH